MNASEIEARRWFLQAQAALESSQDKEARERAQVTTTREQATADNTTATGTRPGGQPRRCLDVTRAEREFGFRASTDFRTGLRQTVDWYREQRVPLASRTVSAPAGAQVGE